LEIEQLAKEAQINLSGIEIINTSSDPIEAAKKSVQLTRDGVFGALMKGSLHTEELMASVVSRDGLRTQNRISHLFLFDIKTYPKLLGISDCVVNIAPDLAQKKHILRNSLEALDQLSIRHAKVAIVAATEVVNPAMPATTDARALVDEHHRNAIYPGALIEGPFGFDNAISTVSAKTKGINSSVSGDPDLILVPDLQVGNILYKALVYLGGAECAGVILGASVPIILTSRSDSIFSRLASTALAMHLAKK
jgi:phosphate acetyltransferase/phosphate butyryltransferase